MLSIPEEGHHHPTFKHFDVDKEALDCFLKFDFVLDGDIALLVELMVKKWFANLRLFFENDLALPHIAYQVEPESFRLVIAKEESPIPLFLLFLGEIEKSPLQITEQFLRKRTYTLSQLHLQSHLQSHLRPHLRPHLRTHRIRLGKAIANLPDSSTEILSKKQIWACLFDELKSVPPRTTFFTPLLPERLKKSSLKECVTEPIALSPLRIRYGVIQAKILSEGVYNFKIQAQLVYILQNFHGALKLKEEYSPTQKSAIKTISFKKRMGYEFILEHYGFYSLYGQWFRMREYELFQALREIVKTFRLSPVVLWKRNETTYTIQLWENWTYNSTK